MAKYIIRDRKHYGTVDDVVDRIEQLEAALAAADTLADAAHRTVHDDADTSLVDALAAYRQARGTTR